MKISFFSTQPYDKVFFDKYNIEYGFELLYFDMALTKSTASLVAGSEAVCVFVNDKLDSEVFNELSKLGVKIVALRCAGFNNVDIEAAKKNGIKVCRVPAYSPEAVAEHAVAMLLTLNRKTHKAYNRVREQNFSLNGLLGYNLHNKSVGVIGTGNIGKAFCKIMLGFGCKVSAYDLMPNRELETNGVTYKTMNEVLACDIISLHCPLNDKTRHLINSETISLMRKGVVLINTSRGALIDTKAVIKGLKDRHIAHLGIDVYEQEEQLFFRDLSSDIIQDDQIQRLMSFSNVLITAHQAFFTEEALAQISKTTLKSIKDFHENGKLDNVSPFLA